MNCRKLTDEELDMLLETTIDSLDIDYKQVIVLCTELNMRRLLGNYR